MRKMWQSGSLFSSERLLLSTLSLLFVVTTLFTSVSAQQFQVIHTFSGGTDGGLPYAGVTADSNGNLYGTTQYGGYMGGNCAPLGCGIVFQLKHTSGGWVQSTLYAFRGQIDGRSPQSRVVFGPDGALYGITSLAHWPQTAAIFRLTPWPNVCRSTNCPWNLSVLYSVNDSQCHGFFDTCTYGDLAFDAQGNIYGTMSSGGFWGQGSVFELVRGSTGWTMSTLYSFPVASSDRPDAFWPLGSVTFDSQGNLWGTSFVGGGGGGDDTGPGGIFELTNSNGVWSERFVEYPEGGAGYGGLVQDQQGGFYGGTLTGGSGRCSTIWVYPLLPDGCGTVFHVSSSMETSNVFEFLTTQDWPNSGGPMAALTTDASGNLYGTTSLDTDGAGAVFRLTPGTWQYTALHDFTGGADGAIPVSNVTFDSHGNMFGTASTGGQACSQYPPGCGVVWEIVNQN